MNYGCKYMFQNRKNDQLALMYKLFSRVNQTLKFIIQKMDIFIIEEGRKVTQDSELTTNCDENGRELSRDLLDNKRMQQA